MAEVHNALFGADNFNKYYCAAEPPFFQPPSVYHQSYRRLIKVFPRFHHLRKTSLLPE